MNTKPFMISVSCWVKNQSIIPATPRIHVNYCRPWKGGGGYELSKLQLSTHSGTHIDAPAHFIVNGKTIDQYEGQEFILSTLVVDIGNGPACLPEDLSDLEIGPGEAVLFRTENSTSGRCRNGVFSEEYVYITQETAEVCVEKGISLIGLD